MRKHAVGPKTNKQTNKKKTKKQTKKKKHFFSLLSEGKDSENQNCYHWKFLLN